MDSGPTFGKKITTELIVSESVQRMYRDSTAVVRSSFGTDRTAALNHYAALVDFVTEVAPVGTLLDVGCGSGWSTTAFAQRGYDATGLDLNAAAFEPEPDDRCRFREGSATELPFASESFDCVVSYQCLEHVPNPEQALREMARVCKPGGVVAIVGPNLLTPLHGIRHLAKPASWKIWRRTPDMPRHPLGNTVPEVIAISILRSTQLLAKLLTSKPQFIMRQPDTRPPFYADNDACYLCCPIDLIAFFRQLGFTIVRRGKPGRPPLSWLFAGGTWIAAKKQERICRS